MNRSHLVIAAAILLVVLAAVQLLRRDEPPRAAAPPLSASAAAPPAVAAAPPPAPAEGAAPMPGRLRVTGEVTNSRGDRVPGVRVDARGSGAHGVTGATGGYELLIEPTGGTLPTLRFSADGYRDALVELAQVERRGEEARVDVRLEPVPGATVSGTLTSERGSPIAGETVRLESAALKAQHAATTDANGRFVLFGVEPSSGYYLSVRPQSGYGDFQRSVDVGEEGLSLDIALRELSTTRLSGRLLDVAGRPIPNLDVRLISGQAVGRSLAFTTDAAGRFTVDDVPTGYLSLSASAPESLALSGILLRPGADADLTLRADWGDGQLRGRVLGADRRPVGSAEVELSWSHVGEGSSGRTQRTVVTGADGSFGFRRLGDGVHRLDVRAAGYKDLQVDYEVGTDAPGLELELEALREES